LIARRRTILRRGLTVLTGVMTAGALVGMPTMASARTANPPRLPVTIMPVTKGFHAPQHIDNLTYGGAKVQVTNKNYVIFWEPPKLQDGTPGTVSALYNSLLQRYFNDVGGNGLYNNNTQYYETVHHKKKFIKNVSSLAGVWVDTTAYPTGQCSYIPVGGNCVTDANIQSEVNKAIAANGWKATTRDMFFVFTDKGEGSTFMGAQAFNTYCAYHWFFGKTMYANMPYGNTFPGNCTTRTLFPNDPDADVEISIASHEQMEAVTDGYYPNGWNSPQGEIGDLCAYNYGNVGLDGGKANEQWNGNYYIVQQEWSNAQSKCVQSGP
jgi:hypothetical protein